MAERWIRASEVGEYEYCARAWWMARVLGLARENPEQLAAGTARHARHGRRLALAGALRWAGLVLVLTALVIVVLVALTGGVR